MRVIYFLTGLYVYIYIASVDQRPFPNQLTQKINEFKHKRFQVVKQFSLSSAEVRPQNDGTNASTVFLR